MSWQACAWADSLEHYLVGPLEFRVLLKLANVANPEGTVAFRSKATMADELGVDQKSVQRALKALVAAMLIAPGDQEFVHHIRADKRPTVYELNFRYKTQYGAPELGWPGADERGDTVIHNTPERGDTVIHRGDRDGSNGGTATVPQGTVFNDREKVLKANHSTRAKEKDALTGADLRDAIDELCPAARRGGHFFAPAAGPSALCEYCSRISADGALYDRDGVLLLPAPEGEPAS